MAQHPFPVDPILTGISLAYRNQAYIADSVLPRVKVGRDTFKYRKFDKDVYLTVPDTFVGRKGMPNQVELSYSEQDSSTIDYGLDDVVPFKDIQNAPEGYDPQQKAVEYLTDLILLAREKRAADLVFAEGSYSNTTTLTGTAQFSNASSNPITTIKTGLDTCFLRPNAIVMGREVFSTLSTHAKIVSTIYPNANGAGIITPEQLAQIFDVEHVFIGSAWLNSAAPGQTASVARVWGKHVALLYLNPNAGTNDMPTFGLTAELGNRHSGVISRPELGLKGANVVRVGEQVRELVIASDLGYFIKNAIA